MLVVQSAAVHYDPPQPAAEIFTCTRQHVSLDTAMSKGRTKVGRGLMRMSRQLSEAFHTARCVSAGKQAPESKDLILAPGSSCSILHACIAELGSRPSKGEGKAGRRRQTTRGEGILSGLNAMTRAQRDHHATVSMHVPCSDQCLIPECANKLQIDWVEIRRSALIPGECGLFATRDIPKGTYIASFGPLEQAGSDKSGARHENGIQVPLHSDRRRRYGVGDTETWARFQTHSPRRESSMQ